MSPWILFCTLFFASLVIGIYARATAGLTPTGKLVLDIVLAVVLAIYLFFGFPRVTVERSSAPAGSAPTVAARV